MSRVVSYFLKGLVFVVPLALTVYVSVGVVRWLDGLIPIDIPGLGILAILAGTLMIGYLATYFITKPFFEYFEKILKRLPLVNMIYSSFNDLMTAFVGDKRKFDKAVVVNMDAHGILQRIGFITNEDLKAINLPGKVAVYFPISYSIAGDLYIVDRANITPLDIPAMEIMTFLVSGGMTDSFGKYKKKFRDTTKK
ncbi:DUF502 domain-containing protein [Imperialibacter roseus]|jgi:uncharacterized membrane protein|uniref:DUF502 domain-containing protein n=1 Tax=Imperialibacter roseus TaxID=1324217 RepID=A0ABZ0IRP5_9BACT|nr:DUF502 domain-containing protein [Imperialibacter roseus]WOK07669.1 DUF502 domain-containing protein [Imperialibacter roseus]|tara:strand:+ start:5132 stop:5716 length:585 start_codon:yes stop_codon:yes gene_type:complete